MNKYLGWKKLLITTSGGIAFKFFNILSDMSSINDSLTIQSLVTLALSLGIDMGDLVNDNLDITSNSAIDINILALLNAIENSLDISASSVASNIEIIEKLNDIKTNAIITNALVKHTGFSNELNDINFNLSIGPSNRIYLVLSTKLNDINCIDIPILKFDAKSFKFNLKTNDFLAEVNIESAVSKLFLFDGVMPDIGVNLNIEYCNIFCLEILSAINNVELDLNIEKAKVSALNINSKMQSIGNNLTFSKLGSYKLIKYYGVKLNKLYSLTLNEVMRMNN